MQWQLLKLSTGEPLTNPGPLPENWYNIFGMHTVIDRLHNLEWAGLPDYGWFITGPDPKPVIPYTIPKDEEVKNEIKKLLQESDWAMLPDVPMTSEKKLQWKEYRRQLRSIKFSPDFPDNVKWPQPPD